MFGFKSQECKDMFRHAENEDLPHLVRALAKIKSDEIDTKFRITRSCSGMDNGNYSRRVSALGRVFHDAGSSDVAALLIDKGATLTPKMVKELLQKICSKYETSELEQRRGRYPEQSHIQKLDRNMADLCKFAFASGIDWDDIKVDTIFSGKQPGSEFIIRMFGSEQAKELGVAGDALPEIVPGEPTARLLKKSMR